MIFYVVATFLYPGGSQVNQTSIGFSWINNYWCNLLNIDGMNGQHNPARPVALAGMFILCLTLSIFFYLFPQYSNLKKRNKYIVQYSGMLAMTVALFLFTRFHDIIIDIAGLFGVIALIGTFIGLYKIKWLSLLRFGLFNLFLVLLNNYVYYTKGLLIYLPVIQKVSFLSFLLWICLINITMYHQTNE